LLPSSDDWVDWIGPIPVFTDNIPHVLDEFRILAQIFANLMLRRENVRAHFTAAVQDTTEVTLQHSPWAEMRLALFLDFSAKPMDRTVFILEKSQTSPLIDTRITAGSQLCDNCQESCGITVLEPMPITTAFVGGCVVQMHISLIEMTFGAVIDTGFDLVLASS
jgi:hypothetical protein